MPPNAPSLRWTTSECFVEYRRKKPAFKLVSEDMPEHIGLPKMTTWCPRAESNHDLMITNQLHDLHATGAELMSAARIIAEAAVYRIYGDGGRLRFLNLFYCLPTKF